MVRTSKASSTCTNPALILIQAADMAKRGFQLAQGKLFAGWNKECAANPNLNSFCEAVQGLKGVPKSYVPPLNTPAE
ncbi:hypothetical protein G6O67_007887 [Ophiocordyceps sinensis]|uniref:Uncharacterized protein n=1 Tax=Ophiocordyceps sinensis TaxID=72228 RepID=A0A8H4LSN7_9HYPO|nr:hypothetical protein G6O67_007887 [Ophiocordyceps sinensis]